MKNLTKLLKMRKLLISALFITASQQLFAYEVIEVCATYVASGENYEVEASIFSGSELNQRTKTVDYDLSSDYAVIFWTFNQSTIVEMNGIGCPVLGGCRGIDQNGRHWNIKKDSICF